MTGMFSPPGHREEPLNPAGAAAGPPHKEMRGAGSTRKHANPNT